mgnify:CR=1 FL=1|tara:strand:+ start:53161 stop:53385 length:225 start_codon:yes stop_codon:yes gene_type:complete
MNIQNTAILSFFGFLLTFTVSIEAYVGPGSGLSAIGTIFAFIGAILLAIIGFVWYPIKRLLKKKKNKGSAAKSE